MVNFSGLVTYVCENFPCFTQAVFYSVMQIFHVNTFVVVFIKTSGLRIKQFLRTLFYLSTNWCYNYGNPCHELTLGNAYNN